MVVPVGTCYEDAWRYLIKEEEGELIHGTVESLGRRIGHAWVELPTGFIWEPRTKSYFSIKDFHIAASPIEEHRYTVEEAAIMLSRVGKHGPWTKEEREQFLKGGNPKDSERLLKVAIEREPLGVAKQLGYEVHRLSPKDIVDKDDYARGYRYRLSKADPRQPYPQIIMARNEGEVATFLKSQIKGNPIPEEVPAVPEVTTELDRAAVDLYIERHGREAYERGEIGETLERIDQKAEEYDPAFLSKHPELKGESITVYHDPLRGEDLAVISTQTGEVIEVLSDELRGRLVKPPEVKLGGGNPIPEKLDLARTLAIIDSRPKGRIIESKLREEFGDAVIDALRQGRYVVSGSAGYDPPLLVSLKGRELIRGGNPTQKVITKEEAIGLLERLSMTPGEAARSLVADEAERREIMQTVQQRVKREQNKWAPMDPREGPPLPRFFAGLRWPWKK